MKSTNQLSGCGCNDTTCESTPGLTSITDTIMLTPPVFTKDEPCCGPPAGPPADPDERPGYDIRHFVDRFIETAAGKVPVVKTTLSMKDHIASSMTRLNIGRNDYKIAPGIYCTGTPDENSPVLVTANYKLSFDHLRIELTNTNAWILVLDTRGINVWCAAGKGSFGTWELVNRIRLTGLERLVSHNTLIVPQLGATGVSGRDVKKTTGFKVLWGPVHTKHLPAFLENNMKALPEMRQVTFSLSERMLLVPIELSLVIKPAAIIFLSLLIISGIGPDLYSLSSAWTRGVAVFFTIVSGIIAGAVITPMFLKQLPGAPFSVKGVIAGVALSLPVALSTGYFTGLSGITALVLFATSISSYVAMNFTGTTPFTSPTGVEKEMKIAIPLQAAAALFGLIFWIMSAF